MRIAITGKGGSAKSTVAGTLARHVARRGRTVVAVEPTPNPNLGISLGMTQESVETVRPILNALLRADVAYGGLRRGSAMTICGRAMRGPGQGRAELSA